MDNDELRLREQEIENIKSKIDLLTFKIKNNKEVEKTKKKYRNLLLKLMPIFIASRVITGLCINSIPLNIYAILGTTLGSLAVCSVPCIMFNCLYLKSKKETSRLNVELNDNKELLLVRTNNLNELKNKNNKIENEYTNYKYKIINNSNSLVESKTSGKSRIRKREK